MFFKFQLSIILVNCTILGIGSTKDMFDFTLGFKQSLIIFYASPGRFSACLISPSNDQ